MAWHCGPLALAPIFGRLSLLKLLRGLGRGQRRGDVTAFTNFGRGDLKDIAAKNGRRPSISGNYTPFWVIARGKKRVSLLRADQRITQGQRPPRLLHSTADT